MRPIVEMINELKHEHALLFEPETHVAEVCDEDEEERPPPRLRKSEPGWRPLPARVLAFFEEHETTADLDTLADALGGANRQTLRACMVTLTKEGRVQRVDKGVYGPIKTTTTKTALVVQR